MMPSCALIGRVVLQHMRRGVIADTFFIGLHERYDESLRLMALWLGWDVRTPDRCTLLLEPALPSAPCCA